MSKHDIKLTNIMDGKESGTYTLEDVVAYDVWTFSDVWDIAADYLGRDLTEEEKADFQNSKGYELHNLLDFYEEAQNTIKDTLQTWDQEKKNRDHERYRIGWTVWNPETKQHDEFKTQFYYADKHEARRAYEEFEMTDGCWLVSLLKETTDDSGAPEYEEVIAMRDRTGEYPWWEL